MITNLVMETNIMSIGSPLKYNSPLSHNLSQKQTQTIFSSRNKELPTISIFNRNTNYSKTINSLSKAKFSNFQITTLNQPKEFNSEQLLNSTKPKNNFQLHRSRSFKLMPASKERFNKEMSDDFIANLIFEKANTNKSKIIPFDNRFNLLYSENNKEFEANYDRKYSTINSYRTSKKSLSKRVAYVNNKIKEIHHKVFFMRAVTNFVFPQLVTKKIKEKNRQLYSTPFRANSDLTPSNLNEIDIKARNKRNNEYYSQSIAVISKNHSVSSFKKNF